jgi:hypothetical protein
MNSLSSGMSLQNKYAGLGGFSGSTFADLNSVTSFFFSFPGHGKTALVQSNPDAFIINTDLSTTVTKTSRATFWPGLRDGRPVDTDGSSIILSHEHIDQKLGVLRKLSQDRAVRPRTVVFDSLSTWIDLVMDFVLRNSVRFNISKKDLTEVQEGNKQAIYGASYDLISATILELRNLGYGVCILGHVAKSKIPVGENLHKEEVTFSFGHGLWKRLAPIIDVSAMVHLTNTTVSENVTEDLADGKGGFVKVPRQIVKPAVKITVDCAPPGFMGMTKSRVAFPPLTLPEADSWAALNTHYLASMESAYKGVLSS